MENCLKTQLKAVVNNDNLPYFDQIKFLVYERTTSTTGIVKVKKSDESTRFPIVIGTGVSVGLSNPIIGPAKVTLSAPYYVYGSGLIGVTNINEISSLETVGVCLNQACVNSIIDINGLTELSVQVPGNSPYTFTLESDTVNSSVVKLNITNFAAKNSITIGMLATAFPSVEELTMNEYGLNNPKEFAGFVSLEKLTLMGITTMNKVIENMVKEYINSGIRTSGTLVYNKLAMSDSFNNKELVGNVDYTVTWTASQINVTDGDQFNETITL